MRMWMINPKLMCRNHLLGEHRELHPIVGMINKNTGLEGYARKKIIEVNKIIERHDALKNEMIQRGYMHKSPLPFFSLNNLPDWIIATKINVKQAKKDLLSRCEKCRVRHQKTREKII